MWPFLKNWLFTVLLAAAFLGALLLIVGLITLGLTFAPVFTLLALFAIGTGIVALGITYG